MEILLCMISSNVYAQRSFSALRQVKTWLQSLMSEKKLDSFDVVRLKKDLNLDIDETVIKFIKIKV